MLVQQGDAEFSREPEENAGEVKPKTFQAGGDGWVPCLNNQGKSKVSQVKLKERGEDQATKRELAIMGCYKLLGGLVLVLPEGISLSMSAN